MTWKWTWRVMKVKKQTSKMAINKQKRPPFHPTNLGDPQSGKQEKGSKIQDHYDETTAPTIAKRKYCQKSITCATKNGTSARDERNILETWILNKTCQIFKVRLALLKMVQLRLCLSYLVGNLTKNFVEKLLLGCLLWIGYPLFMLNMKAFITFTRH